MGGTTTGKLYLSWFDSPASARKSNACVCERRWDCDRERSIPGPHFTSGWCFTACHCSYSNSALTRPSKKWTLSESVQSMQTLKWECGDQSIPWDAFTLGICDHKRLFLPCARYCSTAIAGMPNMRKDALQTSLLERMASPCWWSRHPDGHQDPM